MDPKTLIVPSHVRKRKESTHPRARLTLLPHELRHKLPRWPEWQRCGPVASMPTWRPRTFVVDRRRACMFLMPSGMATISFVVVDPITVLYDTVEEVHVRCWK